MKECKFCGIKTKFRCRTAIGAMFCSKEDDEPIEEKPEKKKEEEKERRVTCRWCKSVLPESQVCTSNTQIINCEHNIADV